MKSAYTFRAAALALAAATLAACGGTSAPPVINVFSINPGQIQVGGSVTLSWNVTGATRVTIDNGLGDKPLSGTAFVTIAADTTFTLTAFNDGAPAGVTKQATVQALTAAKPLIRSFVANPGQVVAGAPVTLSWSVANAVTVSIDGTAVTGSSKVVTPTKTTTYTLSVTGGAGSTPPTPVAATARVAGPPTISAFSASASPITQGQSATLSWAASADVLSYSLDNGVGALGLRTSAVVRPSATTTYTLTAATSGGTSTRTATITVNPAAGTRALAYTDPATIPADALLKLVQDPSSTSTKLVLKLVTTQATTAGALAFGLALDGSRVALDASASGDASPGFLVNAAALDPGSPAAAKASLRTDGPLANVLTFGISRKSAGGGAKPGDAALASGTEVARFRLVIAPGAGPGAVFPLTVDAGHPAPSDAYTPYKALLRAGAAQSSTLPATKVALGTLTLN